MEQMSENEKFWKNIISQGEILEMPYDILKYGLANHEGVIKSEPP